MIIAVVCDSFKGSLTSMEVCRGVKDGIKSQRPDFEVLPLPFADGGEGTSRCFFDNCGGKIIKAKTVDPINRPIEAEYTILPDGTAVIDTAAASGLTLLTENEQNPLKASSFGTGLLIKHAVSSGCTAVVLGLGGSATNDGGMGILSALGAEFIDSDNLVLLPSGENMIKVRDIRLSSEFDRMKSLKFTLACDVENPFYGENGAAFVFATQKGANECEVKQLDSGLCKLCEVYKEKFNVNVQKIRGSGAAGGIAGGMSAAFRGEIKSGFSLLSGFCGLEEKIALSDIVITGEGKTDSQTFFGKLPKRVSDISRKYGKPCILLSGDIENGCDTKALGFFESHRIMTDEMTLEFAMTNAFSLLKSRAAEIAKNIK